MDSFYDEISYLIIFVCCFIIGYIFGRPKKHIHRYSLLTPSVPGGRPKMVCNCGDVKEI